jgi:hypothetical protein
MISEVSTIDAMMQGNVKLSRPLYASDVRALRGGTFHRLIAMPTAIGIIPILKLLLQDWKPFLSSFNPQSMVE